MTRLPWLLQEQIDAEQRARAAQGEIVRDLVLGGYSWADVGRMLGVTRQASRQRYGALVDEWRADYGKVMPWELDAELVDAPEQLDFDPSVALERYASEHRFAETGPEAGW